MMGKAEKMVIRDEGELWHKRLGHLHHGALQFMQQISTGLLMGKISRLDQCKGCTMGKYVKSNFHEKDNHASGILQTVHIDVCGPFSVASTTKHKHYVIFVDDFSRNVGSSSCKRRIKHSQSSVILRHWLRKSQGSK